MIELPRLPTKHRKVQRYPGINLDTCDAPDCVAAVSVWFNLYDPVSDTTGSHNRKLCAIHFGLTVGGGIKVKVSHFLDDRGRKCVL